MEQHMTTKTQVMTGVTSTASSSCFSGPSSRLCFMYLLEKHSWSQGHLASWHSPQDHRDRDGRAETAHVSVCPPAPDPLWPQCPPNTHTTHTHTRTHTGKPALPLGPHSLSRGSRGWASGHLRVMLCTDGCELPLSTTGTAHRPHLLSVAQAWEGLGSDPGARAESWGMAPRGPLTGSFEYSQQLYSRTFSGSVGTLFLGSPVTFPFLLPSIRVTHRIDTCTHRAHMHTGTHFFTSRLPAQ